MQARCGGPGRIRTSVGEADGFTARSLWPLGHRPRSGDHSGVRSPPMASFDVVSEIDLQEVRNAVDQAAREVATRYDFKNTQSSVHFSRAARTSPIIRQDSARRTT